MIQEDSVTWIRSFEQKHFRRPRVLHIGNIANNAYLNAKILNKNGIECDVLCYDYYHIMGCPEWEDADFVGENINEADPDWDSVNLNGFQRPAWFIQGPLELCVQYLHALRSGDAEQTKIWKQKIRTHGQIKRKLLSYLGKEGIGWTIGKKISALLTKVTLGLSNKLILRSEKDWQNVCREVVEGFGQLFPDRTDKLTLDEIEYFGNKSAIFKRLLSNYDIVIGYATDGVFPLLAGKRPYFAFEHGTIRNIPFEITIQGRLCALTYRLADGSFITNCDNIKSAERLGLTNFRFLPHPVNEDIEGNHFAANLRHELAQKLQTDFIVFHPPRQHWEEQRHPDWEKGNDIFIRGLARFIHEVNPKAAAVFVEWGNTVDASKALLSELGISDRVLWIPPQGNVKMIAYVKASNLLADQFFLGAFGSTMPKALLHGCPAMLYLDEERHRWCLPEMPPVINTRTDDEVFAGLKALYQDKDYQNDLIVRGKEWYQRYHSNEVIAETFLKAFRESLDNRTVI